MFVAMIAAWILSLGECSQCSAQLREVKLCQPHAEAETALLQREGPKAASKDPAACVAALDAIAQLTEAHTNAPSAKVATKLAKALEHDSHAVRMHATSLLGPPQHGPIALEGLIAALKDAGKQGVRLGAELKSLEAKLAEKADNKRRGEWTRELEAAQLRSKELNAWRRSLITRLVRFPDDRAVSAVLEATPRNLLLSSDVELVRLGSKKALRGLLESFAGGDKNLALVEQEYADLMKLRQGKPKTLEDGLAEIAVERLREQGIASRRELLAAFAERGLSAPAPEAKTEAWTQWIQQNLGAFPESLPGVTTAAWKAP